MPTTPVNGLRYPALTDSPNGPLQIQNLATDLDARVTRISANQTELAGVNPGSVNGFHAHDRATNRRLYWSGTQWIKYAGPREVLFSNGNAGASGFVSVSSSAAVISPINITAPVAADTGHIHAVLALTPEGAAAAGNISVTFPGMATWSQVYDIGTGKTPIVFELPVYITAGTSQLTFTINNGAASRVGLSYSSVRVTM